MKLILSTIFEKLSGTKISFYNSKLFYFEQAHDVAAHFASYLVLSKANSPLGTLEISIHFPDSKIPS